MSHPLGIVQDVLGVRAPIHVEDPVVDVLGQYCDHVGRLHDHVGVGRRHRAVRTVRQARIAGKLGMVHRSIFFRPVRGEHDFLAWKQMRREVLGGSLPDAVEITRIVRGARCFTVRGRFTVFRGGRAAGDGQQHQPAAQDQRQGTPGHS
jgi:hypothetical protein